VFRFIIYILEHNHVDMNFGEATKLDLIIK
jgi:hypothetical protein